MCFVWIWEQTAIISLYSINSLVFITETQCVYCAVRTGSLYTASLTFNNCTFCPHSVFMCFVWIWEQTAIIFLYSINWLVFITETECLLRGTDWIFTFVRVNRSRFGRAMAQVAGLSPPRSEFDPRSVHVRFVVDDLALRQVFPVIPPVIHIHLHLHQGWPSSTQWKATQFARTCPAGGELNELERSY